MRRAGIALALAGLSVAIALVAREGARDVLAALAAAGSGVLWASAVHVVPMVLSASAWRPLVPRRHRGTVALFTWLVWVREAVDGLLPVARVGGEVAAARLLVARGAPPALVVASIVAELTVSLVTQAIFTVLGLALLAGRGHAGPVERAGWAALAAAAVVVVVVAAVQRLGAFEALGRVAQRLLGARFERVARGGRRTDRALRAVYRGPRRVLACAAWQLAAWIAGSAEVWAFLALAGSRIPVADAIALEAMVQAVSSAAFLVPAALGVQEAAFVAVGAVIGLPAPVALAAALFRRARDVLVFVPALLAWQAEEGRRVLGPRAAPRGRAGG